MPVGRHPEGDELRDEPLLSEALNGRIIEWLRQWERWPYQSYPWPDNATRQAWLAEGHLLVSALNEELRPHGWTVVADFERWVDSP